MKSLRVALGFLLIGTAFAQTDQYIISTYAGGAPPPTPVLGVDMPIGTLQSAAADAMGNTYFVASHCVFRLDQNGVVTRIAGNARPGYSGDHGPATSAQLQLQSIEYDWIAGNALPPGIAVDNGGNVYVADNGNYRLRRISPDGIITTIAGNGTPGFSGDGGPAVSAQLSLVFGLAVDPAGNVLIADSGANRIRRVTADGNIATIVGTGDCGLSGDNGPALAAQICGPTGIAADASGNLFITDSENNRIRQVTPDGTIATVAGTGSGCGPTLGDGGPAMSASLCAPTNVAVDQAGNLFVADTNEDNYFVWWQVVRKIFPGGMIATVAGYNCLSGGSPNCDNAPGNGTIAKETLFFGPLGLAVDNAGNLLIADDAAAQPGGYSAPEAPHIYKASSSGALANVAGNGENGFGFSGDGGPAASAQLSNPSGVAVDSGGNVFIADSGNNRIRKVTPDGIITTVAGNGNGISSGDGGPAADAQVGPIRLALDGGGDLFFFEGAHRSIRGISRDGIIDTVTVIGGNNYFVAADRTGDVFAACSDGTLSTVCEISPDGAIHRVAGGPYGFSGDNGPATSAALANPQGVAVDSAGNLFIADSFNNRIRKVTPDGIITTVAGSGPTTSNMGCCSPGPSGFSGDGGLATRALLAFPSAVAVDGAGNLFIADYFNNRIRMVSPDGVITTIAGDGTAGYSGDGFPAIRASLSGPVALAVDDVGNIYVSDSNNAIRILRPIRRPRNREEGR